MVYQAMYYKIFALGVSEEDCDDMEAEEKATEEEEEREKKKNILLYLDQCSEQVSWGMLNISWYRNGGTYAFI